MALTRREWGLATLGLATGTASHVGCSPVGEESPPREKSAAEPDPAAAVLNRSVVIDLHCDTPMRITGEGFDLGRLHDYGQVDIPRLRRGGVSGIFFSIYTSATGQTPREASKRALEIIDAVSEQVARHPEDLVPATSADEIVQAKQQDKIAVLMGVEGGHMIDSSLAALQTLFGLGARYLTLTHGAHTPWADSSAAPPVSNGLTPLGREIVQEMNRLGMMVDVSHVSDRTFHDALDASSAPIIASHSSCRALASHARNMSDEMLRALARNGGVVHINYYNAFLDDEFDWPDHALKDLESKRAAIRREYPAPTSTAFDPRRREAALREVNREQIARVGRPPLSRLIDHFEHAARVAGVDHVGLGSDFDGVRDQLPQGMEDISKIPNLIAALLDRGFSEADVEKILGGNTLRVMRQVEQIAGRS